MPIQKESRIEDFAFEFLKNYYTTTYNTTDVLVVKNGKTKHGAEADGLFCFKQPGNTFFTASLSVHQSATLSSLLSNFKKSGLSKVRFLTASIIMAGTFFLLNTSSHWALTYLLPAILALIGFVIHTLLEKNYLHRRLIKIMNELKRLPAEEQWIGISISSLCFKHNSLAAKFLELCKKRGVGLITVGKRAKVIVMLKPRVSTCQQGDFLSHYTSGAAIRKSLNDSTSLRVA